MPAQLKSHTQGATLILTLSNPEYRNALGPEIYAAGTEALIAAESNPDIKTVVITGEGEHFCAGGNLNRLLDNRKREPEVQAQSIDGLHGWIQAIRTFPKPVIAAVSGFALGGGCELAMMCDFIIAADNAKFGQPEIKLGIIPGAGGTQRLPRAVGKAKAMDLALTGRMMDAVEAEKSGLVSRVVTLDKLMEETLAAALMICSYSQVATRAVKESVNRAFESGLSDGVMFERRLFHALFATEDQKEGMDAFVNKRAAVFSNK